ncbi:MAG TPA: ATP-binding protein [Pyrinomonadaceae bacterium]|nr:ATP-binding protein [Pyrinomonadaceae bacterium]
MNRVLGRVAPELFVGRAEQVREIASLAPHAAGGPGLLVQAAPMAGASELLRQSYDELFRQRGGATPVYFAFSRHDGTNSAAARRFLQTFLAQLAAHRRDDASLATAHPALRTLVELAAPSDYEWVEQLVQNFERASADGDERALVRLCFNAPREAAERGTRAVVMLDDVHLADRLAGATSLGAEVAQAATDSTTPFVLAGLRRRLLGALNGSFEVPAGEGARRIHLDYLRDAEAGALAEALSRKFALGLNDETRDLIIQQFEGNPYFISSVLQAAHDKGRQVASFGDFQKLYVDELLGGRIHQRFGRLLEEVVPSPVLRRGLLRVLHESASNAGGKAPVEALSKRLGVEPAEVVRVMKDLHAHELAGFYSTYVETTPGVVWRDYLKAVYRLHVAVEPRALVVADTLVEALKRAPQTMARFYRREAAMRLSELLARFDSQRVPASLLRNDRFARTYRGVPSDEVLAGLESETDLVRLPQVVHVASCGSFHPPFAQFCDEERCAVAHGFDSGTYSDANEVVWIAAEIESKLEAGRALAELWLDRLAQVAHACAFARARLWLLSPEGFTPEASELLNEREAFSSSRQQLELLTARIGAGDPDKRAAAPGDEFEMVIPFGDDTELIAASTVEQIARRLDFQPEAINQIKTALVEACINAAEHSLSPDRKIYQRFRLESDKLTVTVSSRGRTIPPPTAEQSNGHDTNATERGLKGRRGWGLKLIRTLMDEVEFEPADDGTRLRMTKYLRK